jgi:hypothetical protein
MAASESHGGSKETKDKPNLENPVRMQIMCYRRYLIHIIFVIALSLTIFFGHFEVCLLVFDNSSLFLGRTYKSSGLRGNRKHAAI